jgi:hypothetical protein
MGTRVYRYGLLKPVTNEKGVDDQLVELHLYRNALVEIERERRAAIRKIVDEDASIQALFTTAQNADTQCIACSVAVSKARVQARSQNVHQSLTDALKQARALRLKASKDLRAARRARSAEPDIAAEITRINALAKDHCKNAYSASATMWGSKQIAVDSQRRSVQDLRDLWVPPPLPRERIRDGIGIRPNDPRFRRYDGCGYVSVQFTEKGGLPVRKALMGTDRRFRLVPADERWPQITHSRGVELPRPKPERAAKRFIASLRIGTEEGGRNPIWADFPCILDRELPIDGSIARVTAVRDGEGPHKKWHLDVQINEPSCKPTHGIGAVAIDVGWRCIDDEIRVAAYGDEHGNHGEIRLSAMDIAHLTRPDELRSVRDQAFEAVRDHLTSWIAAQKEVPEWLRERTSTLRQWRSTNRLARLAIDCRSSRFEGDSAIFMMVESWRKQDKHLWAYEAGQRSGSLGRRQDWFRRWADWFAKTYDTVIIENFDKRVVAKRPDLTETENEQQEYARANRHRVAVSSLCNAIKNAVQRRGGTFVMEDPAHTTHDCAVMDRARTEVCGARNVFDQAAELVHTCDTCGATWDQDVNAWQNLLLSFRAAASVPMVPAPVVIPRGRRRVIDPEHVGEKRWDRVRRIRAERKTG